MSTESKTLKEGQKVFFKSEKQPYTVKSCNERWAICTKPFNLKKTVIYTIVDFGKNLRGTENLIFCMGFETKELCDEALGRLVAGESEVSKRNQIELDIDWTKTKEA